eukprot:5675530-Karenia_brevis.AAC.1
MLDKYQYLVDLASDIYLAYQNIDFSGTCCTQDHLREVEPTPLIGAENRSLGKHSLAPLGPIGLLLQHVHHFGASLDLVNNTLHRCDRSP